MTRATAATATRALGRALGYRIYYAAPGFKPRVRPLFRAHGVWCGIDVDTLAPENPWLLCWRAADGLELSIAHQDAGFGGEHSRREKARGYRPAGFRLLGFGRTVTWRCRDVVADFAEQCSTRSTGTAVFTCTNTAVRLTCRNRRGRGFRVNARTFYAF
jgi:hypothetical protein